MARLLLYRNNTLTLSKNLKFTQNKITQNSQRVLFSPLFPPLTAATVDPLNDLGTRPCFSNQPKADVTGTRADDAAGWGSK